MPHAREMRRTVTGRRVCLFIAVALAAACARQTPPDPLDAIASQYITLATALMQRDAGAASGDTAPATVSPATATPPMSLADLAAQAGATRARLGGLAHTDTTAARRRWLDAQLRAVEARARQLDGATLSLDDELRELYAVSLPARHDAELEDAVRRRLEALLPGPGPAAARLDAFESDVVVPAPRLPAVFERALQECRTRTRRTVNLPADDSVSVKYVVGEAWSGFSSYQGHGRSVVSVNTGFPLTVDRVLQLACHEGYPGHHVINLLRDTQAHAGRPELGAVPLYSPDAYETEALAGRAAALVFTDDERTAFERDVLFPLAGLRVDLAERHVQVARLVGRLAPSLREALTGYLSGALGFVEANWALEEDAFMRHPQATLAFARLYRGFSLAYTGAVAPHGGVATEWLGQAGFPAEPVIISDNGDHSPTSSHGR